MDKDQIELYKREVIAREKQAEAMERIADSLQVDSIDTRFGIQTVGEAIASLVRVIADITGKDE